MQRQAYTLFLHIAGFVPFWDSVTSSPAFWWFWTFAALAVVAQFPGFVHTVRARRGPSPERPPRKASTTSGKAASVAFANWVAVATLWSALIIFVYEQGHS